MNDLLAEFGKRKGGAAVLMPTHVSFVDRFGATEEGNDAGGLTAEMLSLFFREVAAPHSSVHLSLTLQRTPHSSLHVSLTLHHPHCSLLTISTHIYTQAVAPAAGLFELAADGDGAAALPRSDAPPEALRQCGRVMLKAILDDHPLGSEIAPFVLEYLIDAHERRVFIEIDR